MSVYVKLPDGEKTHFVQTPDGVRNLHMKVPSEFLFRDTMHKGSAINLVGEKANIGTWSKAGSLPSEIFADTTIGAFHAQGLGENYIKVHPEVGHTFKHDNLTIRTTVGLDFQEIRHHNRNHGNHASIHCFCLPENPFSGITVSIIHVVTASPNLQNNKLQITSYNAIGKPHIEYASGNTAVMDLSSAKALEIHFRRLPANTIEVEVLINHTSFIKKQFTVDARILEQSAIIFSFNNGVFAYDKYSEPARLYALTIFGSNNV
jgi:hypothetical protein